MEGDVSDDRDRRGEGRDSDGEGRGKEVRGRDNPEEEGGERKGLGGEQE